MSKIPPPINIPQNANNLHIIILYCYNRAPHRCLSVPPLSRSSRHNTRNDSR